MNTSLVIMAAGIGSRFGDGVKQLKSVGPNNELIIDYSIHDAIEAGFDKIIFIIRRDIEEDFRNIIGNRIEKECQRLGVEVCYAFQSIDDVPAGVKVPAERIKPWGTGQAVLSCKGLLNEPFAVINADDYYGKEAFVRIHGFLENYDKGEPDSLCMAGFVLKNTLSENGAVTRGICQVNDEGFLTDIVETRNIIKKGNGAYVDNKPIDMNSYVSMNMWGFTPEFIGRLETGFTEFFENIDDEIKSEFLIPVFIGKLLREKKITVKVLEIGEKWFGITYKEDVPAVQKEFENLIQIGYYKDKLFED